MKDHSAIGGGSDTRSARNYVSAGRNPNVQHTCGWPRCGYLKVDGDKAFGWCQHMENRVPPSDGWPTGFTPSVSFSGGCDLHTQARQA